MCGPHRAVAQVQIVDGQPVHPQQPKQCWPLVGVGSLVLKV